MTTNRMTALSFLPSKLFSHSTHLTSAYILALSLMAQKNITTRQPQHIKHTLLRKRSLVRVHPAPLHPILPHQQALCLHQMEAAGENGVVMP